MGSSSVLERHFAAAAASTSNPEQQPQLRVNNEDGPIEMMPLANTMDDEKSVGLVGATICFTPESSPVSSPKVKGAPATSTVYSLHSGSNNYIGSVHEGHSDGIMESVVSIMKSSVVRIASSLDGRSITEYEVLDGINSRGTIEYEDLISENGSAVGVEHQCARSEESTKVKSNEYRSSQSGSNKSALLLSGHHLSESIMSCPSLDGGGYDDVTLPTLASPFRDFKSSPSDDEARVAREEEEYSGSLTNSNTDNLSDERDAVVENEERTDGGSVNSSPIDDRPQNAFMNLQKFWEGHTTLSTMTKSMMWRVLGTETPTAEVPEDGKAGIDAENIAVAATPSESTDIKVGKSSEGNANIASTSPADPSDPTLEEKLPEPGVNNSSSDDNAHGLQTDSDMGIIAKCKHVTSTIISATASLCFLVMFVYICNYLPTPGDDVTEEVADLPLVAIPSEEPTYEEIVIDEKPSPSEGYWIIISTVLVLMIGAFMFSYKRGASSTAEPMLAPSTNHVTGIWSEEEHRQFLEGYNKHGSKWTQVSTFVPTRSVTQVRAHGNYWLKVRSPTKMTRARVAPTPANSPDNPMKKVDVEGSSPSSVSSGKSTPTKSNKTSNAKTPVSSNKANKDKSSIKGILTVKDRNRSSKHVTPKTEHKARKSVVKQGPKSDPVRRVRIQAA